MNANVVLGLIIAVFGALPVLIGSNAVYVFLTLGIGDLLAKAAANNVTQLLGTRMSNSAFVNNYVEIGLLVIAPIIVILISHKTVRGVDRLWQLIPALATVVVCFWLINPMLTPALSQNITNSHVYSLIMPYYKITLAIGLFTSVVYLWLQHPTKAYSKPKT